MNRPGMLLPEKCPATKKRVLLLTRSENLTPELLMRRRILFASLLLLPLVCGCSLYDVLFCALSSGYTDGGYTEMDKRRHFDQQIEAYEGIGSSASN